MHVPRERTRVFKMAEEKVGNIKTLSSGAFPEVVLLKIFSNLSIQQLGRARSVCKQWNTIASSDILWKSFIPKLPGFVPPQKSSAFKTVMAMWKSSVRIGNERWYANPLPELVQYESKLRKAESHQFFSRHSTTTLYVRLNPCYDFTTKGKETEDARISEACNDIFETFKDKREDQLVLRLETHTDVMKGAEFMKRKEAMDKVLQELEPPYWFLEGLSLEPRQLDEDGNIINASPHEQDEEIKDDLGDVAVSKNKTIFGEYRDYTAWTRNVNQRLPVHLYQQIKAIFAGQSKDFIEYYLNDGCWNENYEYAFSVLISNTAAFYIEHFYEL